jgi:outer membrane receptor protein involved in Fe transport
MHCFLGPVAAQESGGSPGDEGTDAYSATGQVRPPSEADDARSTVTRRELEERLPRSAPDALRYEPGVYIQQTAHAQASPYVRGLTGQQVVHLFDGIRMNNGLYRQGPNQYFFSIDARSLSRLDVLRGSASVLYGSDALGGAILATPLEPTLDPENEGLDPHARAYFRFGSADLEIGGRGELELAIGDDTAMLLGGGYRDVDLLVSGGVVPHLTTGTDPMLRGDIAPWVPRFEEEAEHPGDPDAWFTQLGTGFREATFDARLVHAIDDELELTVALYGYQQYDAPRTDQCPPQEAPIDECLSIDEQFRTLGYVALRSEGGDVLAKSSLVASIQQHHEARQRVRPRSFVELDWVDDVLTLGLAFSAETAPIAIADEASFLFRFGADAYRDGVGSEASQSFTDLEMTFPLSRGQYVDGSLFASLGAFFEVEASPFEWLTVRSGARAAFIGARADGDEASGTAPTDRDFGALVGRGGVEIAPVEPLSIFVNVDQGFRAPNLDDLTSRQQTGPGFQIENPDLRPEKTLTFELGTRLELEWITFEAWAFATILEHGIVRAVRDTDDCPPETPQCQASRNPLVLVNAERDSHVLGAEGGATIFLPHDVTLRTTLSYAWGEGPNTGSREGDPTFGQELVPLSRMPPFNGTFEARWRHFETGLFAAAAMRWAAAQTRLAPSDLVDARIPRGGTREYAVFDLRAGWRFDRFFRLSVVFENVFDAAWRAHGSSVNGPGRGITAELMAGF